MIFHAQLKVSVILFQVPLMDIDGIQACVPGIPGHLFSPNTKETL